jgi:bisphosphoglycerate-independent phosphoglycerate mutase (AlkP superfamily)
MYISFDETDDWAHDRRYDRVLESLQFVDRSLGKLWSYLQGSSKYRGTTTLVITTDHGRGSTLQDFSDHGPKVPGDEQIWAAFIGPDTPMTGEATNAPVCYQRDIAPTILNLLGFDYREYIGVEGKPINGAIRSGLA